MSIKVFSGLGTLASTYSVDQKVNSSTIGAKSVVVDPVAKVPLDVASRYMVPKPPPVAVVPNVQPEVFSVDSGYATYDTLYVDFMLEASPVYNFWTEDETTNDRQDRGDRELIDLPRYVRLTWNVAPDLNRKKTYEPFDPTKRTNRTPVKFSVEDRAGLSFNQKGVEFSPRHLEDFSLVKASLANPYVAPATVKAVIEFPLDMSDLQKTPVKEDAVQHIDEDSFLDSRATVGVSINELKSVVSTMTHGIVGAEAVSTNITTAESQEKSADSFVGKFSVERSVVNGGRMNLKSVVASSPSISFIAATARSYEPVARDPVVALAAAVTSPPQIVESPAALQTKVSFVDPSIGGLFAQEKVNSVQQPEHAEAMIAIAQFIPNLDVLSRAGIVDRTPAVQPPSFPAPPELADVEYIGYVIEKYFMNETGAFVLVETIDLDNREYSEYIDCKVVYGGSYRYRIKALVRWTRPANVGVAGYNTAVMLAGQSNTKSTSDYVSSYFSGEWCKQWSKAIVMDMEPPPPPDEMTVRPFSSKKGVMVTCKLPFNPQRDIDTIRVFKKEVSQEGKDISDWTQVGPDFPAKNVMLFDSDVDFYQDNGGVSYKYAAQCVSKHREYSTLSDQILVRLNKDYKVFGEYPASQASQQGVRLEHHGSFSVYPFKKHTDEIIVKDSVGLVPRTAFGSRPMQDGLYVMRVESLDDGEKFDFPVVVSYNYQPEKVNRVPVTVYIPTDTRPPEQASKVAEEQQALPSKSEVLSRNASVSKRSQSPT